MSCYCGHAFSTSAAFKNHSKGCDKNRKHFSSILTRAQESYNSKRHCLSSDQDTIWDPGSFCIDGAALQPRDASTTEKLVPYEVRTNWHALGIMPSDSPSIRGLRSSLGTQKIQVHARRTIPYPCHFNKCDMFKGSQRGLEICFRSHLNHYPPLIWFLFCWPLLAPWNPSCKSCLFSLARTWMGLVLPWFRQ